MKVPKELVELSDKATPGPWFWDDEGINTTHNPFPNHFHPKPSYQRVLWPYNSLGTDAQSVSELMGACGSDTEVQAEANQKLLVACVNYVRQLLELQEEERK